MITNIRFSATILIDEYSASLRCTVHEGNQDHSSYSQRKNPKASPVSILEKSGKASPDEFVIILNSTSTYSAFSSSNLLLFINIQVLLPVP